MTAYGSAPGGGFGWGDDGAAMGIMDEWEDALGQTPTTEGGSAGGGRRKGSNRRGSRRQSAT